MAKIALLATGDEIINGDILNTNGATIAKELMQKGLTPGMHATASDEQSELEAAMAFLLEHHDVLITIGGLGPTSDDRTRFSLANTLGLELKFDEPSWDYVQKRLKHFKLDVPESNRQQCLFPQGASILQNPNGTANACKIQHNGKYIYMLPGPPGECLPLFKTHVLPELAQSPLASDEKRKNWLLFGVSEGTIAEEIEERIKGLDVTIGYRIDYPYLELKLHSPNHNHFNQALVIIEPFIEPSVISVNRERASKQLYNSIISQQLEISIVDHVTGGMLETLLMNPESYPYINFNQTQCGIYIEIQGLEAFWQQDSNCEHSAIKISINKNGDTQYKHIQVPYRGRRMQAYATEAICLALLKTISS